MEDKNDMVEIYVKRFNELLEKEAILEALYANGVDNWEGYDDAMESLEEEE